MEPKIAIQGIKGSFHHQVAELYFSKNLDLEECMSFETLVKNVKNLKNPIGIMALENSIAGSIIPNYALIDRHDLHIVGEYYLDIHHQLMGLKGQRIEDITEVQSHPMALLQCADFFAQYPHIKLVESSDTAETARRIETDKLKGIAAIASKIAAELYGLEIIAKDIHTINNNATRFVIVKNEHDVISNETINKASLKFELEDQPGNLAKVLTMISDYNLNMTKILSLPIITKPFQYSFFVDVVFDAYEDFKEVKINLFQLTKHFKVLGEYKNGKS